MVEWRCSVCASSVVRGAMWCELHRLLVRTDCWVKGDGVGGEKLAWALASANGPVPSTSGREVGAQARVASFGC